MISPRRLMIILAILAILIDLILIRTGVGIAFFICFILILLVSYLMASWYANSWCSIKQYKDYWGIK